MLKKTIISATFGAAVLIAASAGANAMPSGLQQATQTGTAQADIIRVGGKHKKFKHFRFHHGYYHRYYRSCYWMKKKAKYLDSDYWWNRYEECKYFYRH